MVQDYQSCVTQAVVMLVRGVPLVLLVCWPRPCQAPGSRVDLWWLVSRWVGGWCECMRMYVDSAMMLQHVASMLMIHSGKEKASKRMLV